MSDEIGQRRGSRNIRDSLPVARETANRDTPQLYEFGPFRLDPTERKLVRGNEIVALTPKALDTLLLLVRNSGHLLEKDELIATLWPNTFVEEGSLSNHIFLLRKALGRTPRILKRYLGAVTASLAPCDSCRILYRRIQKKGSRGTASWRTKPLWIGGLPSPWPQRSLRMFGHDGAPSSRFR